MGTIRLLRPVAETLLRGLANRRVNPAEDDDVDQVVDRLIREETQLRQSAGTSPETKRRQAINAEPEDMETVLRGLNDRYDRSALSDWHNPGRTTREIVVVSPQPNGQSRVSRQLAVTHGVTGPYSTSPAGEIHLEPQASANGAPATVSAASRDRLLGLSERLGEPVRVFSGDRTLEQNRRIPGAAPGSAHLTGDDGADIGVSGMTALELARAAFFSGLFGRTNYYTDGRTHVDMRSPNGSGYYVDWTPNEPPQR